MDYKTERRSLNEVQSFLTSHPFLEASTVQTNLSIRIKRVDSKGWFASNTQESRTGRELQVTSCKIRGFSLLKIFEVNRLLTENNVECLLKLIFHKMFC